jgi:hypothetical protein
MTKPLLNTDSVVEVLNRQIAAELSDISEAVVLKALAEMETIIRRRLAGIILAQIDSYYSVETMRDGLVINVKYDKR